MAKTHKKEAQAQSVPTEASVMKALDDLSALADGTVEKGGDPLLAADPDGGFATQGESLRSKMHGTGSSKAAKAEAYMSSSSSSDEESDSDDESSDDGSESSKKSLIERAHEEPVMRKGINATDFLDRFTSTISDVVEDLRKGLEAKIDASQGKQHEFNRRIAKALITMGNLVVEQGEVIKSLKTQLGSVEGGIAKALNAPAYPNHVAYDQRQHGAVVEPTIGESGSGGQTPLDSIEREQIQEWLFQKAAEADPKLNVKMEDIAMWEHNRYNPRALRPNLVKALEQEFCG